MSSHHERHHMMRVPDTTEDGKFEPPQQQHAAGVGKTQHSDRRDRPRHTALKRGFVKARGVGLKGEPGLMKKHGKGRHNIGHFGDELGVPPLDFDDDAKETVAAIRTTLASRPRHFTTTELLRAAPTNVQDVAIAQNRIHGRVSAPTALTEIAQQELNHSNQVQPRIRVVRQTDINTPMYTAATDTTIPTGTGTAQAYGTEPATKQTATKQGEGEGEGTGLSATATADAGNTFGEFAEEADLEDEQFDYDDTESGDIDLSRYREEYEDIEDDDELELPDDEEDTEACECEEEQEQEQEQEQHDLEHLTIRESKQEQKPEKEQEPKRPQTSAPQAQTQLQAPHATEAASVPESSHASTSTSSSTALTSDSDSVVTQSKAAHADIDEKEKGNNNKHEQNKPTQQQHIQGHKLEQEHKAEY